MRRFTRGGIGEAIMANVRQGVSTLRYDHAGHRLQCVFGFFPNHVVGRGFCIHVDWQ